MVRISSSQFGSSLAKTRCVRILSVLFVVIGTAIYSASAQTPSLSLTVTNWDGSTNNGQVALGQQISLTSHIAGMATGPRTWQLQGGGSIAPAGTPSISAIYTAPLVMPASSSVTITAYMTSAPTVTVSYQISLTNPVPTLTSVGGVQATSGSTTSVTLTGTGFVSGTVVTASPGTVTTTYNSPTSLSAQITLPTGATGNVSLQATNSTPGGGTGAALQVSIASLQETAVDPDGTNTGTARLGVPVNFSTTNTDLLYQSMGWTLTGAGTLTGSSSGAAAIYTPPLVMPANPSVTVTAYLKSFPTLTTSYTMTLINPVPMVTGLINVMV